MMKKYFSKILIVFLTLALVCATVPAPAPVLADSRKSVTVMPVGDSITVGLASGGEPNIGGYRVPLWQKYTDAGLKVDMVGPRNDNCVGLPAGDGHAGNSGWYINQVRSNIVNWINAYRPQVVLLHIGTNDIINMDANNPYQEAPQRLEGLIDDVLTNFPDLQFFVATIIRNGTDVRTNPYNDAIREIVARKQLATPNIHLVDMAGVIYPPTDTTDYVHPKNAGYAKMADRWFEQTYDIIVDSVIGQGMSLLNDYAHSGSAMLKHTAPGTAPYTSFFQTVGGFKANTDYTASFWIKGKASSLSFRMNTAGWSAITSLTVTGGPNWTKVTKTFNSGDNNSLLFTFMDNSSAAGFMYIDDCSITEIGGTLNLVKNPGFEIKKPDGISAESWGGHSDFSFLFNNADPSTATPKGVTFMPLGDSITNGVGSTNVKGGYRYPLWQKYTDSGLKVDMVGTQAAGNPNLPPESRHCGYSGWRIDQLLTQIDSWMTGSNPQFILLHIGTNDILQNYDIANAPQRLEQLIDKIMATKPTVQLYVASIVRSNNGSTESKTVAYNAALQTIVESKGANVHFVDMHAQLLSTDISSDNVHPNDSGYAKMATTWFNATKDAMAATTGVGAYTYEPGPRNGDACMEVTTTPVGTGLLPVFDTCSSRSVPVESNQNYKISFWVRGTPGTQVYMKAIVTGREGDWSWISLPGSDKTGETTSGWAKYSITLNVQDYPQLMMVFMNNSRAAGKVYIDDCSIVKTGTTNNLLINSDPGFEQKTGWGGYAPGKIFQLIHPDSLPAPALVRDAHGGNGVLMHNSAGTGGAFYSEVVSNIDTTAKYILSYWSKAEAGRCVNATIMDANKKPILSDAGIYTARAIGPDPSWRQATLTFDPEGNTDIIIALTDSYGAGLAYIDDVTLVKQGTSTNLLSNSGFETNTAWSGDSHFQIIDTNNIFITFNNMNGDVDIILPELKNTLVDKPVDPVRVGYDFGGWFKEADCVNQWNFATDLIVLDTTLYAKWTQTPVFATFSGVADRTNIGGTFDYRFNISNNPGISTYRVKVTFDNEKITPQQFARGGALIGGDISSNMDFITDWTNKNYVTVLWVDSKDSSDNGTLFTIQFKVKNDIAPCMVPIVVTYEDGDVTNANFDDKDFVIENTKALVTNPNNSVQLVVNENHIAGIGNTVSGSLTALVINDTDAKMDTMAVLAIYNSNGMLVDKKLVNLAVEGGNTADINFDDINATVDTAGGYHIRMFLWNSISIISPYMNTIDIL